MNLDLICNELRKGSEKLALQTANEKNIALKNVAIALDKNRKKITARIKKGCIFAVVKIKQILTKSCARHV